MTDIKRGDIWQITRTASSGYEIEGGRPAIVVSNDIINAKAGVIQVVFLTTAEKKPYPTHVPIMGKLPSTALCEQISNVSRDRFDRYIKSCTSEEMAEIDKALLASLALDTEPTSNKMERVEQIDKEKYSFMQDFKAISLGSIEIPFSLIKNIEIACEKCTASFYDENNREIEFTVCFDKKDMQLVKRGA